MNPKYIVPILEDLLGERMEALGKIGGNDASRNQRHLDEGTTERTYWHYGYASALKDVLGILHDAGKTTN